VRAVQNDGPHYRRNCDEYTGKAKICKINTDESRDSAIEFGISANTTLILFKGASTEKWVGLTAKGHRRRY